jgi:alpha-tubulin suppressor-like RCC1 family protein
VNRIYSFLLFIVACLSVNSSIKAQSFNGAFWTWGKQKSGLLGIGNYSGPAQYKFAGQTGYAILRPEKTSSDSTWIQLSAGLTFSMGLKSNGTLWSWGSGYHGQTGNGSTTNSPQIVNSNTDWKQISAGYQSAAAIKNNGTLWTWGRNEYGQLGLGNNNNYNSPQKLGTDSNWKKVLMGYDNHVIAIKTNGTLWAWGFNNKSQLGTGNTTRRNTPIQIGSDTNWVEIAVGYEFTLALKSDGTMWAWGNNQFGALGRGNTTNASTPIQVGTANNWIAVSTKQYHVMALKSDSSLWVWGYNNGSRLGLGSGTSNVTSPTKLGTSKWIFISAGERHSAAIASNGELYTWGINLYGQLGNNSTANRTIPTRIGQSNLWKAVECGQFTTYGIEKFNTNTPCTPIKHVPISSTSKISGCSEITLKSKNTHYVSQLWSTGATTTKITVTQSGPYKITETDSRGCKNTDSVYVELLKDQIQLFRDTSFCNMTINGNRSIRINRWFRNTSTKYVFYDAAKLTAINAVIGFSNKSNVYTWNGFVSTNTNTALKCPITGEVTYTVKYPRTVGKISDTIITSKTSIAPYLRDGAFRSYLWSTGATTLTTNISNSGSYWFRYTDSFGCHQYDTFHFSILNLSVPVSAKGNLGAKIKLSVTDSSNSGSVVNWSNNKSGWNQFYTITKSKDTITATISDAYRSISKSIIITSNTSLAPASSIPQRNDDTDSKTEENTFEKFTVYPNPANQIIFIQRNFNHNPISVYTIDGKRILTTNKNSIDISSLSSGLYFVSDGINSVKIFVQP